MELYEGDGQTNPTLSDFGSSPLQIAWYPDQLCSLLWISAVGATPRFGVFVYRDLPLTLDLENRRSVPDQKLKMSIGCDKPIGNYSPLEHGGGFQ